MFSKNNVTAKEVLHVNHHISYLSRRGALAFAQIRGQWDHLTEQQEAAVAFNKAVNNRIEEKAQALGKQLESMVTSHGWLFQFLFVFGCLFAGYAIYKLISCYCNRRRRQLAQQQASSPHAATNITINTGDLKKQADIIKTTPRRLDIPKKAKRLLVPSSSAPTAPRTSGGLRPGGDCQGPPAPPTPAPRRSREDRHDLDGRQITIEESNPVYATLPNDKEEDPDNIRVLLYFIA